MQRLPINHILPTIRWVLIYLVPVLLSSRLCCIVRIDYNRQELSLQYHCDIIRLIIGIILAVSPHVVGLYVELLIRSRRWRTTVVWSVNQVCKFNCLHLTPFIFSTDTLTTSLIYQMVLRYHRLSFTYWINYVNT